jgi:BirA family biotin operon repressor/biotin-[acetyl-CoA-carboxylase] ligase
VITTELLTIDGIRRQLATSMVGRQLYLFGEVDSTNAKMRALARAGAREGTVVLAEGQTAGRGRHGREWFSPSGVNLYASVLFRPSVGPGQVGVFPFMAPLAVCDAARDLGVHPAIKWPNDVLVDGRKFAGTLVECAMRGDEVEYVILGVGVNLNVDQVALKAALGPAAPFAVSLATVLGHEVDRSSFAASYLNHLEAWTRAWQRGGVEVLRSAWANRDVFTGRRVEVRGGGRVFEGRVLGLDVGGGLVVQDPLGQRHTLTTEEVRALD